LKKIILFLSLFLIFVACSSDDDNNDVSQEQEITLSVENLTGTWLAVEYRENNGAEFQDFENIPENERYTYKFKNDLTIVSNDFSTNKICSGEYSIIENNRVELNFECTEEPLNLSVSFLTKNNLIISKSFGVEGIKIKFKKQN